MNETMSRIREAASFIKSKISFQPEIAIILGSGLGPLAQEIEHPVSIDYKDIPHFPMSTVPGHDGKLIAGTIQNKTVLVMKGRFHYYEGYEMDIVTFPIRVFAALGIHNLIVTNASGGIRDDLNPGSIMFINDHIGFLCPSPLRGPNLDEFGPRFQDMTEIYSNTLIHAAQKAAEKVEVPVSTGVYAYFKGPNYESPAEIRAIRTLGADAVGMSTVPETIVAKHCGMSILGISLITNKAAGLNRAQLNHAEVMETASNAEKNLVKLTKQILADWEQTT